MQFMRLIPITSRCALFAVCGLIILTCFSVVYNSSNHEIDLFNGQGKREVIVMTWNTKEQTNAFRTFMITPIHSRNKTSTVDSINKNTADLPTELEIKMTQEEEMSMIRNEMKDYPFREHQSLDSLLRRAGGKPIQNVIVTSWRSGSTLLGEVLESHPANYFWYEPLHHFGVKQIREEPEATEAVHLLRDLFLCHFTSDVSEKFYNHFQENMQHFAFKRNSHHWNLCQKYKRLCWNHEFLGEYCKLFPYQTAKVVRLRLTFVRDLLENEQLNLKVVYLIRDPRGTMNSRKGGDVRGFCQGHPDCDDPAALCRDLVDDYAVSKLLQEKYPGRLLTVRYEDLSSDPHSQIRHIFEFLGMDYHPKSVNYTNNHINSQGREVGGSETSRKNSIKTANAWKDSLRFSEIQTIQNVCGEAIDLWGYQLL